ncbi:tripartite tricarboxylate transporter TctB family protein [Fluviibacterium sp. DFM31]|uniref:Tripartite tricarboxylate transporter TctB family protein n=1 Tax=Meridianimarinicoccus marinus TaxID=3231483 RepID=A0ABV3LD17_9RHOB
MEAQGGRSGQISEGWKDLVTAVGLLVFALAGFLYINPNGSGVWPGPGGMTWRTMPFIYSSLLSVLSIIYVVQSILKIRAERKLTRTPVPPEQQAENRLILFRRVATFAFLMAYVSLLRVFGFAIVTPIFLFALFRLYARGDWKGDAVISLVGAFALWLLFVRILHLNLKGYTWDPVTPFLLDALSMVGL